MKKVLVGVLFVAIFAVIIGLAASQPDRIISQKKNETYEKIMEVDLEYDYPESATDVVKLFCEIEALLYSYKFEGKKEGRFEELVRKQINLYDEKLIDYNGGENKIILSTKQDAEKFLDLGYKIVDVKYQTSPRTEVDENGNLLKFVNVIEYVSIGDNAYKQYMLRKDENKRWKIVSYANVEPFTIS